MVSKLNCGDYPIRYYFHEIARVDALAQNGLGCVYTFVAGDDQMHPHIVVRYADFSVWHAHELRTWLGNITTVSIEISFGGADQSDTALNTLGSVE